MDFSNMTNMPKRNRSLVSAAFVMGIISIVVSFTCFSFLAPALGGLGILFAILSKGKESTFDKKAKYGLVLSSISVITTVILTTIMLVFSFVTLSKYEPEELHDYLNEAYEEAYGKSFDEFYEELYGEDFNEVYDELYQDIYGNN